jgi:CheY-like chemotaxis protein
MPEMDGLKAAQVIRESIPLQQPPKVILVTAYGNELASDQAERAGLLAVLAKPISNSSLFDGIMHAFTKSAPEADSQQSGTNVQWAADLTGLRVLLVEDNEINRELASQLLRDAGIIASIAHNGREAGEGRRRIFRRRLMNIRCLRWTATRLLVIRAGPSSQRFLLLR